MTDRGSIDLDAALDALAGAERRAWPAVSDTLRARVLTDAATVAAGRSAAPADAEARRVRRGGGWLAWFGGIDAWAGAAIAATVLCLATGIGIGYDASDSGFAGKMLAEAGLADVQVAKVADGADGLFLPEDVL